MGEEGLSSGFRLFKVVLRILLSLRVVTTSIENMFYFININT